MCIRDSTLFVPRGDGCPTGLGEEEHISWALTIGHPFQDNLIVPDDDLKEALDFEIKTSPEEIDRYRSSKIDWIFERAAALENERVRWVDDCPDDIRQIVSRIHGPLVRELCYEIGFKDLDLVKHLQCGFPYVGRLPRSSEDVKDIVPRHPELISVEELRERRLEKNELLVEKVRTSEWQDDLMSENIADVEFGALSEIYLLEEIDMDAVTLSRRLPVREERSKGWRTRVVDHKSESMVNPAIQAVETL